MCCRRCSAALPASAPECGSILVMASVFVFLMTYIALSAADLAMVEARMAHALRVQVDARTLLDGAVRVVVSRERNRLLRALADGNAPVCHEASLCDDTRGWVAIHEDDQYQVSYQTRARGTLTAEGADRAAQSTVSSHVHYESAAFEVDVRVRRRADNATLARAAVGIAVSAPGRIDG